ncbi:hypothetical protein EVAR_76778_1 [Eumeta japonica]|uniref:Uncharacterized protein n=1 Tax=Eumeta variegata TaxID=151549 RepID=A0A4C1ST92_EUMVA|nr:hypothetical protein EVAR_76778_1 [Eumeta japonica]
MCNSGAIRILKKKTFGLQWDIKNVTLGFNLELRNTPTEILKTSLPPTKRQATMGVDWDEQVKVDEHRKWLKWVNGIMKLSSIKIPRCISPGHTEEEIHVFVYASERSYVAGVYWLVKLSKDKTTFSLIIGKACVAPFKIV